jgi:hypothetical protein
LNCDFLDEHSLPLHPEAEDETMDDFYKLDSVKGPAATREPLGYRDRDTVLQDRDRLPGVGSTHSHGLGYVRNELVAGRGPDPIFLIVTGCLREYIVPFTRMAEFAASPVTDASAPVFNAFA